MELAAADGKFKGYAKPVLHNVNIYSSEEPEKNPLKRIWEGLVDFAANMLENDEKEQVAARIPFTGTIENPKTRSFATIVSVFRNAFVSAFARSLEGSISVRNVRESLKASATTGGREEGKEEGQERQEEGAPARPTLDGISGPGVRIRCRSGFSLTLSDPQEAAMHNDVPTSAPCARRIASAGTSSGAATWEFYKHAPAGRPHRADLAPAARPGPSLPGLRRPR